MTDPGATRYNIEAFVGLAMERRRHAISADDRARMQELEERLRDVLDGARPGPKTLENPQPIAPESRPSEVPPAKIELSPSAPSDDRRAPSVQTTGTPSAGPVHAAVALDLGQAIEQLPLSRDDAAKTNDVALETVASAYTPPRAPAYMQDYYAESVVPAVLGPDELPIRVVGVDGGNGDLSVEARMLFGIGARHRRKPSAPATPARSASVPQPAPKPRVGPRTERDAPALTADLPPQHRPTVAPGPPPDPPDGATRSPMREDQPVARGHRPPTLDDHPAARDHRPPALDDRPAARDHRPPTLDDHPAARDLRPPSGAGSRPASRTVDGVQVVVYLLDGASARGVLKSFDPRASTVDLHVNGQLQSVPMPQVMAVFFRVQPGKPPTPARGTPVTVQLINDREYEGVTPDYEPGGMALTVVPTARHGSVDRVWIPAWAVRAIEM